MRCKNDSTRTYKGTEPSPKGRGYCAHAEEVGKVRIGKDKKKWVVRQVSNGSKRWMAAAKRASPRKRRPTASPRKRKRARAASPAKNRPAESRLDSRGRWRASPWGRRPPRHTRRDIAELRKIVDGISDRALRVILQGPATWEEAGELVRLGVARKYPQRYLGKLEEVRSRVRLVA